MSLRKKTNIIVLSISILLISVFSAASRFILLESISNLEKAYSIKNVQRAINVIANDQTNLLTTAGDYAAWDDTYLFASDHNPEYIAANMNPETLSGLNINYFIFIDKSGKVFDSFGYDLIEKRQIPITSDFNDLIFNDKFVKNQQNEKKFTGIFQLKNGPFLFASHPILTSKHEGPPNGYLLIGRYLGKDYAAYLSKATQSSVQIESYLDSPTSLELKSAVQLQNISAPIYIKEISPMVLAGYTVFLDLSGNPALILRIEMERDIYNHGYSTITFFVIVVLLGCLLFASSIIFLLNSQVLSRITALSESVNNIRLGLKFEERIPVNGKDEISSLAININEMLQSLQIFDNELIQSKDELEKRIEQRTSELIEVNLELKHEINERELSEKALIETYNENNQILSSISSIIIGVNSEHIVTQWNEVAAWMVGLALNEVMGKDFFSLPIDWDWEKIKKSTADCSENKIKVRMDDIALQKSGEDVRILGITLTPLFLKNGEKPGFLLVGADITERRLLEQKLGQLNKMEAIGQMAAGIAHEINTPTQLVGSNLRFLGHQLDPILDLIEEAVKLNQAVKSNTDTPEMAYSLEKAAEAAHLGFFRQEAPKAIEESLEGVDRIASIVSAMRYFSHPGSGTKELANLNLVIQNALSLSRNEWKNVAEIKTDLEKDLPFIECLPSELSQVVLNLIINAVHAIQDANGKESTTKGLITISSRLIGETVEMRVSDSGTGIPEEIRSRIFDPFFTTKDVGRGTGQGLAICYTVIVKNHSGTIEFESELGRGTTFVVRLPRG